MATLTTTQTSPSLLGGVVIIGGTITHVLVQCNT